MTAQSPTTRDPLAALDSHKVGGAVARPYRWSEETHRKTAIAPAKMRSIAEPAGSPPSPTIDGAPTR